MCWPVCQRFLWPWISSYEYHFLGMNIHKSKLFWCELQGYKVLTHPLVVSWVLDCSVGAFWAYVQFDVVPSLQVTTSEHLIAGFSKVEMNCARGERNGEKPRWNNHSKLGYKLGNCGDKSLGSNLVNAFKWTCTAR